MTLTYRAILFLLLLLASASCFAIKASFSVEIHPKKWKGIALRNIPKQTNLNISVMTNGLTTVVLTKKKYLALFPRLKDPLFHSTTKTKISFSVKIEDPGDYVLVLVNNSHTRPSKSKVLVSAKKLARNKSIRTALIKFEYILYQHLRFRPFAIAATHCDNTDSKNSTAVLLLCLDYVRYLAKHNNDKKLLSNLIIYNLLHQAGHIILQQWGEERSANEYYADEFAASLLLIMGNREQLNVIITHYQRLQANGVLAANDDINPAWHAISAQRLAHLSQTVNQPTFIRMWQQRIIPHMSDDGLRTLHKRKGKWIDKPLIRQQLNNRENREKEHRQRPIEESII